MRINTATDFINTPLLSEAVMNDEVRQQILVPLHRIERLGAPKEVAEFLVWSSSEKASLL